MNIKNIFFINLLFNKIDGITLFLPQDIIIFESQINLFFKTKLSDTEGKFRWKEIPKVIQFYFFMLKTYI